MTADHGEALRKDVTLKNVRLSPSLRSGQAPSKAQSHGSTPLTMTSMDYFYLAINVPSPSTHPALRNSSHVRAPPSTRMDVIPAAPFSRDKSFSKRSVKLK